MSKVLIAPSTLAHVDGPHLQVLRDAGLEYVFPARPVQLTAEELMRDLGDIGGILAGSEPYSRRVIEAAPALRVIARAGVGYDAVDVAAATEHSVAVTITPGTNHHAVAEHTFALLLAAVKHVPAQHQAVISGNWPRHATLPLRDRTLGIAGLGRIGKEVALRGLAFHMRVLAYEPAPDQQFLARHPVKLVSFDQLLAESDFLSLHLPFTPESRHLINRQTLARMKPTAFLVNTARGGLVCEADLRAALAAKRLAGAALDVFEQEPPGANPLFEQLNLVLTAHTAGIDAQSLIDMSVAAARSIAELSQGKWPAEQIVNPEVRTRFRW